MRNCELCKYPFIMQTKIKPFKEVSFTHNMPVGNNCKTLEFGILVGKTGHVINGKKKIGLFGDISCCSLHLCNLVPLCAN